MIKPRTLRKNDNIAIVAPSRGANKDTVNLSAKNIRRLGFIPVIFDSCYQDKDISEIPAEVRAKDINEAFKDNSIKGIFALKAGHGTMQILDHLDYESIKNNPKCFVGFSDITGMHLYLNQKCGMVSFYGPLATSRIKSGSSIDEYTQKYLDLNLCGSEPIGLITNPTGEELKYLIPGRAEGQLTGGNLSLLVDSLNTEYEVDSKNKIIFMEDMGESLSDIKVMLNKLASANKFTECSGIILGTWIKCGEEYSDQERGKKMEDMFTKALKPFNKPTLFNLRCGHNVPMLTLPLGVNVSIDSYLNKFKCLEATTYSKNDTK